jgi:hypothetical protein
MKTCKAFLLLFTVLTASRSFSQCSICTTPAAPIEFGGTYTATHYKGSVIQLWAVNPSVAVCELDWFHVVGTDTTSIGTGDTLSVIADTTCQYLARTKNTCSGTTYYSHYVQMGSVTITDPGVLPSYTIGISPAMCSGTPTDIFLWSATSGVTFAYLRSDTPGVTGSLSGTSYAGPLAVTLTNTTGSSQSVRLVVRMRTSSGYYADDKVVYVTVLPSTAPSGNHCFAPSTPNPVLPGLDQNIYAKGSNIWLFADTTVAADSVQWWKVVGTDTTYAAQGYELNLTVDTACQYLARGVNACNCSSASLYYSAWKQMSNYTVSTSIAPVHFKIFNDIPTIASGTQVDLVPYIDSAASVTLTVYRDNANVSGSTSSGSSDWAVFGITLTNTTSVPQLVRYKFTTIVSGSTYGNTVMGYITVLPSTATAPAGNHCSLPLMTNTYQNNTETGTGTLYYVKGATFNLDVNKSFLNRIIPVDSVDWYKYVGPGDTLYIGGSYPVNVLADTNFTIFAVSKNVCYWSDSSKHLYSSGISKVSYVNVLTGTNPVVTMTNNSPNICSGQPTNISVSAPSGDVVGWVRDIQPPVKGAANNSIYYSFPALLKDTLTDTVSTPQIVHFEAHSAVTISGKNCLGSSALAAVNVYPSCSLWAADVIGVHRYPSLRGRHEIPMEQW